MSFRREVGLGLFWVTVSAIAIKSVSMVRDMVLARWLLADELGLVATATIAVGAIELFAELGFSSALIYRKDDTDRAANTAFILVIFNCLVLYGIAWLAAPYVAGFFASQGAGRHGIAHARAARAVVDHGRGLHRRSAADAPHKEPGL